MKMLIIAILMTTLTGCSFLNPIGYFTEDEAHEELTMSEIRKRDKELGKPLSHADAVAYCSEGGVLRGKHLENCIADAEEKGRGKTAYRTVTPTLRPGVTSTMRCTYRESSTGMTSSCTVY